MISSIRLLRPCSARRPKSAVQMNSGSGLFFYFLNRPYSTAPFRRKLQSLCYPSVSRQSVRGAKRSSKVRLSDLPQGVIGGLGEDTTLEEKEAPPPYPTVVQQAKDNMRKFENCVLLTRVGGFYELYFEHAQKYAPLLNLKLAFKKTNGGPVPMAGFPFYQLDRFLKILVRELNQHVAISEEFANNAPGQVKSGGLLFNRKVTRIITPGTLINENFLDPTENNFLLALHFENSIPSLKALSASVEEADEKDLKEISSSADIRAPVGLAWLDLSTGDFFTQSIPLTSLASSIAQIGAPEIVLDDSLRDNFEKGFLKFLQHGQQVITFQRRSHEFDSLEDWFSMVQGDESCPSQTEFSHEEIAAGGSLLQYVRERLQDLQVRLQPPIRRQSSEIMGIDRNSMKGLEIFETSKDGLGRGSLLHAIRRTVTKSGSRLLRARLICPSTSLQVINSRLDLVTVFFEDDALRENIINLLGRTYDSQRIVQKFTLGRGDPDDLISLLRTIEVTFNIAEALREIPNDSLKSTLKRLRLRDPMHLSECIAAAIDEEGLEQRRQMEETEVATLRGLAEKVLGAEGGRDDFTILPKKSRSKASVRALTYVNHDLGDNDNAWVMKEDANPAIYAAHEKLQALRKERTKLLTELRERLGTPTLSLRWTPSLSYICHIKGDRDMQADSLKQAEHARVVSSTKSTRSIHLPEWSHLGAEIDQAKMEIRRQEQILFDRLRSQVIENLVKLRQNASVLDDLDIATALASLAREQNFVRPILNHSTAHRIVAGLHPVVSQGLISRGRSFVPNDCFVGDDAMIYLITGPNMAGKSTYLRQNALISILAQVGSYVPATHAEIGIVDQIFSRIGAADDLFRDQSTFMVEMLETAAILKQATERSFVIMDEVGRGTTPEDGLAVSYACLHHLYNVSKCRTLFATHFHSLVEMTKGFERLGCYCTSVIEDDDGGFMFDRKMRKGVSRQSHALKVAMLAGLPKSVIAVAQKALRGSQDSQNKTAASYTITGGSENTKQAMA